MTTNLMGQSKWVIFPEMWLHQMLFDVSLWLGLGNFCVCDRENFMVMAFVVTRFDLEQMKEIKGYRNDLRKDRHWKTASESPPT